MLTQLIQRKIIPSVLFAKESNEDVGGLTLVNVSSFAPGASAPVLPNTTAPYATTLTITGTFENGDGDLRITGTNALGRKVQQYLSLTSGNPVYSDPFLSLDYVDNVSSDGTSNTNYSQLIVERKSLPIDVEGSIKVQTVIALDHLSMTGFTVSTINPTSLSNQVGGTLQPLYYPPGWQGGATGTFLPNTNLLLDFSSEGFNDVIIEEGNTSSTPPIVTEKSLTGILVEILMESAVSVASYYSIFVQQKTGS